MLKTGWFKDMIMSELPVKIKKNKKHT